MTRIVAFVVVAAAGLLSTVPVAYPDGYREWTRVSSTFIDSAAPPAAMTEWGVHHVYANALALEGLRTGRYRDGARLAYDLLATRTANGVTKEGERRRLDVMEKDSARYRETGGWGFESWVNGDRNAPRVGENGATMCYACHAQRTAQGVFSVFRE